MMFTHTYFTIRLTVNSKKDKGGFGDFYTMKRSGFNNEFLLAKLLKYMEDEQMRSHDY